MLCQKLIIYFNNADFFTYHCRIGFLLKMIEGQPG
jgi:hypothetical protein